MTQPQPQTPPQTFREPAPGSLSTLEARDRFLEVNGFSTDAYEADWVQIPFGPVDLPLPSSEGRKALVPLHDLHHAATGFGTDYLGEAEVAAFELGAGCLSLAAFLYNFIALSSGLLLAPLRVLRILRAARAQKSLYRLQAEGLTYEQMLRMPVGELRARMGLPAEGIADRPARFHRDAERRLAA